MSPFLFFSWLLNRDIRRALSAAFLSRAVSALDTDISTPSQTAASSLGIFFLSFSFFFTSPRVPTHHTHTHTHNLIHACLCNLHTPTTTTNVQDYITASYFSIMLLKSNLFCLAQRSGNSVRFVISAFPSLSLVSSSRPRSRNIDSVEEVHWVKMRCVMRRHLGV